MMSESIEIQINQILSGDNQSRISWARVVTSDLVI